MKARGNAAIILIMLVLMMNTLNAFTVSIKDAETNSLITESITVTVQCNPVNYNSDAREDYTTSTGSFELTHISRGSYSSCAFSIKDPKYYRSFESYHFDKDSESYTIKLHKKPPLPPGYSEDVKKHTDALASSEQTMTLAQLNDYLQTTILSLTVDSSKIVKVTAGNNPCKPVVSHLNAEIMLPSGENHAPQPGLTYLITVKGQRDSGGKKIVLITPLSKHEDSGITTTIQEPSCSVYECLDEWMKYWYSYLSSSSSPGINNCATILKTTEIPVTRSSGGCNNVNCCPSGQVPWELNKYYGSYYYAYCCPKGTILQWKGIIFLQKPACYNYYPLFSELFHS